MNIFISYKREGGIDIAARVASYFTERRHNVFYDILSMQAGRFDNQIEEYIANCDRFVVILTKGALDSDWVKKEIRLALKNKKAKIIPLIMPGFVAPSHLDSDIASVLSMHGVEYNAVLFEQVMQKLNELISPANKDFDAKIDQILESLMNVITLHSQFMLTLRTGDTMGMINNLKAMGQEITSAHDLAGEIQEVNNKVVEQTGKVRFAMKDLLDTLDAVGTQNRNANNIERTKLKNDLARACTNLLQVTSVALQTVQKIKYKL